MITSTQIRRSRADVRAEADRCD